MIGHALDIKSENIGYYTSKSGQTLITICLHCYGSIDYILYFLATNNKKITDDIEINEQFIYNTLFTNPVINNIITVRGLTLIN